MLRITVKDDTLQLEGRLEGLWLQELMRCWQRTLASKPSANLRVDLTGVTYIGAAGKACLEAMYRQGAYFIAADCLTKAIVAEIAQTPAPSVSASQH